MHPITMDKASNSLWTSVKPHFKPDSTVTTTTKPPEIVQNKNLTELLQYTETILCRTA